MKVSRQIRIYGSVRKLFLITLVAGTALPLQAWAQQAVIEEIVVTAQKRTEKLQDVGISMSAFSSEDVKMFGFDNALQVSEQVPNFNFNAAFGPSGPPQLSIRGISILDFSDSNESSIAMYFDEIYKGTIAGQNSQLFDIERIEVLRGPQGTLYGRNTPGGVVHFISRHPTEEFEAGASFQYGSFNQKIIDGFLSGPLSENFRTRVAFRYNEDDGYQTNVFTGTDFAKTDIVAVRGIMEWDITDALTMTGIAFYSDSDSQYPGHGFYGTLDPVTGAPCSLVRIEASECVNAAGFRDPDPDPEHVFSEFASLPNIVESYGGSIKFTWDLEDFELISITGYETVDKALVEDCDAAAVSSLVCFGEWNGDTKEQITQEFRLSGATDSANWIAGAFYFADEKFATVVVPPFGGFGSYATTEAESWALFAQADFELSDAVTLVTGVRYTEEDRDLVELAGVTDGVAGTKLGTPFFGPIADTISTEKITGKIGVEWKPAQDVLGYASITTGFKSGLFNTVLLGAPEERGPVGEETVISYEIGAKTIWWDSRARFNAAVFYSDYTDFQVSTVTIVGGVPVARFLNAGDVSIFGAELELTLIPSSNWEFRFGVGLLDTEIDAPPDLNIGGNQLDGNESPVSPAISLNGLARFSQDMAGGSTVTLQVDFNWKDEFFFGPDNDPFEHQDSFGLLNVRAFWTSPTDRYEASVFVDNVLDEEYATFAFITGSFPGAYKVWGRPLWAGVKFGVNF